MPTLSFDPLFPILLMPVTAYPLDQPLFGPEFGDFQCPQTNLSISNLQPFSLQHWVFDNEAGMYL